MKRRLLALRALGVGSLVDDLSEGVHHLLERIAEKHVVFEHEEHHHVRGVGALELGVREHRLRKNLAGVFGFLRYGGDQVGDGSSGIFRGTEGFGSVLL